MPDKKPSNRSKKTINGISSKLEPEQLEKAISGYQVAVDMWKEQESQGWSRFNVMLVINGLIITAIGFTSGQNNLPILNYLLPIAGLLISLIWLIFMRREVAWSTYYALSARELEEKYLSDIVTTVSRGKIFQQGKEVTFTLNNQPYHLRMNFLARNIREKATADWIILILIALYVGTIIQGLIM